MEISYLKCCWLVTLLVFTSRYGYSQEPKLILPIGHSQRINKANFSADGRKIVTASTDHTAKIWDSRTGYLLVDIKGHTNEVKSACFNPDRKRVLTASADSTAKVWDAETGVLLFSLKGNKDEIYDASYSRSGQKIVTACRDGTVSVWDGETGRLLLTLNGGAFVTFNAFFSFDGTKILTRALDTTADINFDNIGSLCEIWDAETGRLLHQLKGASDGFQFVDLSHDNKCIVTADKTPAIWDAETGTTKKLLSGHKKYVRQASFNRVGDRVITCSEDKTVKIWDAQSGAMIFSFPEFGNSVVSALFTPDNTKIVTACMDGTLSLWENGTYKLLSSRYSNIVTQMTFSPDMNKVLTVSNNIAQLWDLDNLELVGEFKGHTSQVSAAVFSGDNKMIASTCENGTIIWDRKTGIPMSRIKANGYVRAVEFTPDSKRILLVDDSTAQLWDINRKLPAVIYSEHSFLFRAGSLSNDGLQVVLTTPEEVLIYDAETGRLLQNINTKSIGVEIAKLSPGKHEILTSYTISEPIVIDRQNLGPLFKLNTKRSRDEWVWDASYSHDGKMIVTSLMGGPPCIWDAKTGKFNLEAAAEMTGFNSCRFSPDDKYLIGVASKGKTAKICDSKTGKLVGELTGHDNSVSAANYSADGKFIVTGSVDNTVKVWNSRDRQELYTFFSVDSNDYFIQLPSQYYQCTPNAAKLLHYLSKDHKVITFEQLDVKYNRPDKVLEGMGSQDTNLITSYEHAYYKRLRKLGIDTNSFHPGYTIPEADFVNRAEIKYEQSSDQLVLHISGSDKTENLDRFNVWVNEVPIYGVKGFNIRGKQKHSIDTTITVILSQGKNTIEMTVVNINGTESYRVPLFINYLPSTPIDEKVYFVGIGIDHFKDGTNTLHWSVKDIRDQAYALSRKFRTNFIIVDTLFDQRVTPQNIMALKKKLLQTTVNDKVIIAYSGHGLFSKDYDYYLSTYNINFAKPEEGGLLYDELENLLDSIPARKKLLLLDACHSGEIDKDEIAQIDAEKGTLAMNGVKGLDIKYTYNGNKKLGRKSSFELMKSLFVNVGRNTGAVVISAAGGTQFAYEKGELGNGVFTHCILEALKNEHLPVSKLQKDVSAQVSELTKGLQVPTTRSGTKNVDWEVW